MRIKRLIFLFPFLFFSCSENNKPDSQDTPIGNFDVLWQTIDHKYCFLDLKQIDWEAIGDVYRKQVEAKAATITDRELFEIFSSMLDSLHDGHVNLYSDFDVSRNSAWYDTYPINYSSALVYSERYLGADYKIAGGFHYDLIADGHIGYMKYSSFSNTVSITNVFHIFDFFRNCQGLIIDVRNNGGGSLTNSEKLASFFFDEKTTVGYIQHKTGFGHNDFSDLEPFYVKPSEYIYWGLPVVILTDRLSYSATNHFVSTMKNAKQVMLLGGKTGGGSGMPLSNELPNGWLVRFSAVPMYDAGKNHIEDGVSPHKLVNLTKSDFEKGEDTIIEEAVKQIFIQNPMKK